MPALTRQQLADQLNTLTAQGATEQQIVNTIAAAGYTNSDFNIDLTGNFTPLTVGAGKTAGVDYLTPTAAEQADSNNFYKNLAAESTSSKPGSTTTTTITSTETFSQSTGGGTTTVYSNPSKPTPASQAYQAQADQAFALAEAYRLNPDGKFGKAALDKRLADGRLTQDQYNEIVNLSADQRAAASQQYSNQYEQARTNQINSEAPSNPTIVVQPSQTSSEVSVKYEVSTATVSTALDGSVGGTNISTVSIDGVEYQVTGGPIDTTYTPVGAPNIVTARDTSFTQSELTDPLIQQTVADDDAAAQADRLAAQDGLITPSVQQAITDDAAYAQTEALAAADGLITPSVQQSIADDTAYAQTEALAAADGLITPNVASSIATGSSVGLQGNTIRAQAQATLQDVTNFQQAGDWRVRLKLAPSAKYLYKADDPGILLPLKQSDGVIFPYTPQVSVAYAAHYDATELTHSNYKIFQYKNSSVDQISITCDFTAQDTFEANYLLAVIHFFRSVTKMFYGQDQNPNNGTPPPLCYLTGLGAFQFDSHPVAITGFTYSLPNDVDYIRAGSATNNAGVNLSSYESKTDPKSAAAARLFNSNLQPGAVAAPPVFAFANGNAGTRQPTYVPTKMQLAIQAVPIVTRNDISNQFSLKKYATGELLQGSRRTGPGGGIW